ncbi:hypothetical protein HYS47_03480 [Candidatus Woesearchaeota archaeon]|nr:hypothetical protein [Candidatus Woesearchaeota archaeon]
MLHQKKGAVEIQFNWIFILIIGALILTFFFAIAQKQKQLSERRLGADISSELDLLFTGQGVSSNTISVMNIPNVPIRVSCDDYTIFNVPRRLGNTIIFSPQEITGKKMIGMTLPWTVPFKVTNFFYLTTPRIRYIIINAPDVVQEELTATLPLNRAVGEGMSVEFVNDTSLVSSILYQNNPHTRLIFFNTDPELPSDFESVKARGISAVVLQGGFTDFDDISEAHFYRKEGNAFVDDQGADGNAVYAIIGKASALGAMITSTAEGYECSMAKATHRLKNVAEIYRGRSDAIFTAIHRNECGFAVSALDAIISAESQGLSQVKTAIDAGQSSLESSNRNALRLSCPTLY